MLGGYRTTFEFLYRIALDRAQALYGKSFGQDMADSFAHTAMSGLLLAHSTIFQIESLDADGAAMAEALDTVERQLQKTVYDFAVITLYDYVARVAFARYLGSLSEAGTQDLVHETLMRAARAASDGHYRGEARLATYAVGIMKNIAAEWLAATRELSLDDKVIRVAEPDSDYSSDANLSALRDHLDMVNLLHDLKKLHVKPSSDEARFLEFLLDPGTNLAKQWRRQAKQALHWDEDRLDKAVRQLGRSHRLRSAVGAAEHRAAGTQKKKRRPPKRIVN